MSTSLRYFAVVLILAGGALLFWQRRAIQGLRAEAAELRTEALASEGWRRENARLAQAETDAAELRRLREAQTEVLSLRGAVSRLRLQLQEAELSKRALAAPPPVAAPSVPAEPTAPIETYHAEVQASLAPGQSLVLGGWATPGGHRTLVLVEPSYGSPADPAGQVTLQARFVELPDEALAGVGLEAMRAEGKQATAKTILSPEQNQTLVNTLENTSGVNVLSAPRISTLDGRQAEVRTARSVTIDGATYEVGPTLDIVPRLLPNGGGIDLTVISQLKQQTRQAP